MAKPALSYLPETSAEAREANLAYQTALERLTKTLDARKNQTFDPVMMAMAAGFLGPTQTGSFGEALGRAAGLVGKAQEAQYGQDIESAKAGLELAQSGLQLQRQRGLDKQTQQWLQGRGGLPTTTLMQPGGAKPSAGLPGQAKPDSRGGIPFMPPDQSFVSEEDYIASMQGSGKSLGELRGEYQTKYGKDRFLDVQGVGKVDRVTGDLYATPGRAPIKKQLIIGPERQTGEYDVDPVVAVQLDRALMSGNVEEYARLVKGVTGLDVTGVLRESGQGATSEAAPPPGSPVAKPIGGEPKADRTPAGQKSGIGLKPKAELAAEEAATTEAARERAKSLEAQREDLMKRGGKSARDSIAVANILTSFASMPDAKDMFGLASQGNLLPNIVGLLQAGIGLPGGSINIAGLEDFYRNQKLQPEQLERYRVALQQMRTMNIAMSEYAKGSVSNYEQGLFGEASINERDLPGTILLKAEALRARAEFDKEIAELARRNPKLNVEQIKDLGGYKIAEDKLNTRYRDLILKKPEFFKDPAFVDAAKQGKPELISYDRPLPGSQSKGTSLYEAFKQKSSKPK